MSYINVNLLKSRNLSLLDLQVLQLAKQMRIEDVSDVLREYSKKVESLVYLEYLESIKGKKSDGEFQKIRITKLGAETLDLISTPLILEEHVKMRDYLIEMYTSHEDKERVIGNKKLIGQYISILQNYLSLDIYRFYYLCEFFLQEHIYTRKLENIFMDRNKIRFGDFKNNIEDSPLFQFYEQRKQDIEMYWIQKIKE